MNTDDEKENQEQKAENKNGENAFDKFWNSVEENTGSHIPSFIRNVLNLNGFNSPMSIALLDKEDLDEMEKSLKAGHMKPMLPTNDASFFGPFMSADQFYFPLGYKKVLLKISDNFRQNGAEDGLRSAGQAAKMINLQPPLKQRVVSRRGPISNVTSQLKSVNSTRSTNFEVRIG